MILDDAEIREIRDAERRRWAVVDLLDRLRAEISTLTAVRRAALLGYLGGESFAATGRRLGKTGEAVRYGVRRAYRDMGYENRARRVLGEPER